MSVFCASPIMRGSGEFSFLLTQKSYEEITNRKGVESSAINQKPFVPSINLKWH